MWNWQRSMVRFLDRQKMLPLGRAAIYASVALRLSQHKHAVHSAQPTWLIWTLVFGKRKVRNLEKGRSKNRQRKPWGICSIPDLFLNLQKERKSVAFQSSSISHSGQKNFLHLLEFEYWSSSTCLSLRKSAKLTNSSSWSKLINQTWWHPGAGIVAQRKNLRDKSNTAAHTNVCRRRKNTKPCTVPFPHSFD